MKALKTIFSQPSWNLQSDSVCLQITRAGGQMAPAVFKSGGKEISPYSVAPWHGEKLSPDMPQLLKSLRGDFFCAPFGGNALPFRGEQHPPHGESANANWTFEGALNADGISELSLSLETRVRPGRVEKLLRVRDGETVVYSRNTISGMKGPMCFGNHPMLLFPEKENSGLISTSRVLFGQVAPQPFEDPASGGYQFLKPGATFKRLDRVPALDGSTADLSAYPARRGFEDLVLLVHEAKPDFAWTAVVFPAQGFVWFSLKDPRVLRSTILWHSNGGRHYAPWSGRHTGVMGLEDVTAYFHYGLAESARPNYLTRQGIPTAHTLNPKKPLVVNSIQGVARIPAKFTRVRSIVPATGCMKITDANGTTIHAKVDLSFLK